MKEKIKKIAQALARDSGIEVARGYIVKRINSIDPRILKNAIEKMDVDILGKLSGKDLKLAQTLSSKYSEYLDLFTAENIFQWLVIDAPFYAGIIFGHPQGLKWLSKLVEEAKKNLTTQKIKLVPVSQSE